ncbi:MAG: hypothetical protein ABIJ21_07395 [Nanoarchaeota archaeon]
MFKKNRVLVEFDKHAIYRLNERSATFNLDIDEAYERVLTTIHYGHHAKKHRSYKHTTYFHYFQDNLSFYVICKTKRGKIWNKIKVKTIIIERGKP